MKQSYRNEDIDRCLAIFAMESGREKAVTPLLEDAGLGHIKFGTVRSWAYNGRKERYEQIRSEVEQALRGQMGDTYVSLAKAGAHVAQKVVDEFERRVDSGVESLTITELGKILHEISVSTGIAWDKAMRAKGEPSVIIAHKYPELARALEGRGITITQEGRKLSDLDAEVVDEEDVKELTA